MKINLQASARGALAIFVVSFPHQPVVSSAGMKGIAVRFPACKSRKALSYNNLRACKSFLEIFNSR